MGLLSILKLKREGEAPRPVAAGDAGDAVREARTRARRRLIGAVVLLVIGVIGFPLVFETRPRPIPVDIPIEIPKKEGAPALVMPPPRSGVTPPGPSTATPARDEVITETPADAGREIAPRSAAASAVGAVEKPASRPAAKPAAPAVADAARKPATAAAAASAADASRKVVAAAAAAPASAGNEAQRARALLDAKPASAAAADGARFVVQVGAFAEAEAARETRARVEKLGMKTYTQVAQTPSGNRIRVRVGPFGSRAEADAALAKARAAGLTAVVLTL